MRRMLADRVAAALREMGFRGSGQNYFLPSDSHWQMLGRPHRIFARVAETGYWNSRIGRLMPSGLDEWWDLTPKVMNASRRYRHRCHREYALPALRAQTE
jgi:hypothetical protein